MEGSTKPSPVSQASPHPALEALVETLVQELEAMKAEAAEKPTCVADPNDDPENPSLAWNKKLNLEQESQLEALLATPLVKLPDDPALHLGMAVEKMERAAHSTARTLQFYKDEVEELEEKQRKYEDMVKKATTVNEALDKLLLQYRSKDDKKVVLERRYEQQSALFKFLRNELHFILETYNPDEIPTPESVRSMEELMDTLVTQLLQNPSDPYVKVDDTMEETHILLLQRANLVTRHPRDMTRIRFIDPRA